MKETVPNIEDMAVVLEQDKKEQKRKRKAEKRAQKRRRIVKR